MIRSTLIKATARATPLGLHTPLAMRVHRCSTSFLVLEHRKFFATGPSSSSERPRFRIGGLKKRMDADDSSTRKDGIESSQEQFQYKFQDNQQEQSQSRNVIDDGSQKDVKTSTASKAIQGLGAVGTGLFVLGGKSKSILVALKMTKMSSLVSMLASTAAYSFVYGLPFGVGMVGLLLAHESGHALMMRQLGYEFTPMVFLPFMGAVVGMKEPARTAYDDARISIAGPILGGAVAGGVAMTGVALDNQFLMALGDFGLMINLFNLMPIGSLDGAHILGSINKWFLVSALGGGAFVVYNGYITNPMFYILMLGGAFQTWERFTSGNESHYQRPGYEMPRGKKIFVGASYVGLVLAFLALMRFNNQFRKSPQQIKREMEEKGERMKIDSPLGETMMGWVKDTEDPDYFAAEFPPSQHQQSDPFFDKKWA